jgi:hyperosmotically inducible periplasmic protein
MKTLRAIKVIGGTLIVAASLNNYAQTSEAAAVSDAMSTTPTWSAKAAIRALDRIVRKTLSKAKGLAATNTTVGARNGAVSGFCRPL